jgi:hypothetical protein
MTGPNPIGKSEGEAEVVALYSALGVPQAQNIAYAEITVDGLDDALVGVSGIRAPGGTVAVPTARLFATFDTPPGMDRRYDAELKVLEAVARLIQPDAQPDDVYPTPTGSVRLYSHFTICPSCDGVIAAFRAMFPNVVLSTSDGT